MQEPLIEIKNKRNYRGLGVYVGRPNPLGNPFQIGVHGTRDEVVDKYELWLREALDSDGAVAEMFSHLFDCLVHDGDLTLICWCAPERCHADVIAKLLKEAWQELQEEQSAVGR